MKTKEYYLTILADALIFIRSLNVEGDVQQAWKIADMLHNLPAALRYEWTVEREAALAQKLETKAQVHGLEALLRSWKKSAEKFESDT